MRFPRLLLYVALAMLLVLHQDAWNWQVLTWTAGLPTGFLYHVAFCLVIAVLMGLLLHLDRNEGAD